MPTEITTALITGCVTLTICLINNVEQRKREDAKRDADRQEALENQKSFVSLIEYKLEQLTKKVEKHNNVIERTYKLEQEFSVMDEKIKVANNRIHDLEEKK